MIKTRKIPNLNLGMCFVLLKPIENVVNRYPRPYGRGTFKIQAALVRCPAPLVHGCTAG